MCKCTYLTRNLFALRNKKTGREAYACYPCVKDLVDSGSREEMHRYIILRRHRKLDKPHSPIYDIHEYVQDKHKSIVECAHYFKIITDDDRAILLDNACDTKHKRGLLKTIDMFFIIGNGYNHNDLGKSLILNDEKVMILITMAQIMLSFNDYVKPSTRKGKKWMVRVDCRLIHFGAAGMLSIKTRKDGRGIVSDIRMIIFMISLSLELGLTRSYGVHIQIYKRTLPTSLILRLNLYKIKWPSFFCL